MDSAPLTPWTIRLSYAEGIFPMADERGRVGWYLPTRRAIFPIETGMRVSRSLAKTIRKGRFEVRFDTAFERVMRNCLRPEDNWITEEFIQVYTLVHRQGWGHCSECWADGELVGGVYGVAIGSAFFAESMFHRRTDASKVALWALIEKCRELGFSLFDAQIMNPHLESLGAMEIPDRRFQPLLKEALKCATSWSVN